MSSKEKKKNAILNVVMVAAILAVAVGGVLTAGNLKGWFDKPAPERAETGESGEVGAPAQTIVVTAKTGGANITRGGLSYALKEDNRLRDGDVVETLNRSRLTFLWGDARLVLDENSRMSFSAADDGRFTASLEAGGAYAELDSRRTLLVNGETVETESAAVIAAANYGSSLLGVLRGRVSFAGAAVCSGERASLVREEQGGLSVFDLAPEALNSFELDCIRGVGELCFSEEDITALEQRREAEQQSALEAVFLSETDEARVRALREQQEGARRGDKTGAANAAGDSSGSRDDPSMYLPVCTIEIRCDTILENMGALTEGKSGFVPANGIILAPSKISFEDGQTAFDVLKKACTLAGIQLEYSWTPLYNSYYIEGINNLYEFDCGDQSGWMYKVNGWFPNYGCSSYTLEDGDVMVWCFTCKGLGADVGGTVY